MRFETTGISTDVFTYALSGLIDFLNLILLDEVSQGGSGQPCLMSPELIVRTISYPSPASKVPLDESMWSHPMLDLYRAEIPEPRPNIPSKLYLVPTPEYLGRGFSDDVDSEFAPQPSALTELPDLENWVSKFVLTTVEIWGGRRSPMQLASWCHRNVFQQLSNKSTTIKGQPKIRKVYISQPIEGVAETTVTLKIGERVRSLILRFEGVDKRWLCTEFVLL